MRNLFIGFICAIFLTTSCYCAVSGGFRSGGGFSSSRSFSSGSSSYRSYSAPTYIRPQQRTIVQNNTTVVHHDTGGGFGSAMLGAMVGSSLANHSTVVVAQPGVAVSGGVMGSQVAMAPSPMIVQSGFSGFDIMLCIILFLFIFIGIICWIARQV